MVKLIQTTTTKTGVGTAMTIVRKPSYENRSPGGERIFRDMLFREKNIDSKSLAPLSRWSWKASVSALQKSRGAHSVGEQTFGFVFPFWTWKSRWRFGQAAVWELLTQLLCYPLFAVSTGRWTQPIYNLAFGRHLSERHTERSETASEGGGAVCGVDCQDLDICRSPRARLFGQRETWQTEMNPAFQDSGFANLLTREPRLVDRGWVTRTHAWRLCKIICSSSWVSLPSLAVDLI